MTILNAENSGMFFELLKNIRSSCGARYAHHCTQRVKPLTCLFRVFVTACRSSGQLLKNQF